MHFLLFIYYSLIFHRQMQTDLGNVIDFSYQKFTH